MAIQEIQLALTINSSCSRLSGFLAPDGYLLWVPLTASALLALAGSSSSSSLEQLRTLDCWIPGSCLLPLTSISSWLYLASPGSPWLLLAAL